MSESPAIALIEFSSIAAGTFASDAMVKQAPVEILRVGTIHPGRFMIFVGGSTASVELAHLEGIRSGTPEILDDVFLPEVHPQVSDAIGGKTQAKASDALLTMETSTSAAIVRAADAVVKGTRVSLQELRLGDGLGGKGLAWFVGARCDAEEASEMARQILAGRNVQLCESIVSRIDPSLSEELASSSRFGGGFGK